MLRRQWEERGVNAAALRAEEGWCREEEEDQGQEREEKESESAEGMARSSRSQTKRAPGWGPSASAGRYSEATGISRLRLALQGGNSSVFPQGAYTGLGLVRESPMACDWLDDNEENTGFAAVEASPTRALSTSTEGRSTAELDKSSATAAGSSPRRKDFASAGDPAQADGGKYPTDDADASNLADGASIREREPTSAHRAATNEQRGLSGSLPDTRRSAVASLFEASCPAPNPPTARVADNAPALPAAEKGADTPGKLEGGSVSPSSGRSSASSSSSPTRGGREGVAYKYRRRSELAQKQPTPARSFSGATPDRTNRAGGRDHRRSSSSPLPPLSPRLRPSMPSGDDDDHDDDGDDAATSCHSSCSSSPSELESCEDSLFGSATSSSLCAPAQTTNAAVAAAAAQGVTAAVAVVRKVNSGGIRSGSGSGSRAGNVPARSRGLSAQSRVGRGHHGGGGGGHSEICAILGGTADAWKGCEEETPARETVVVATADDNPPSCSTGPSSAPAVDCTDENNGDVEHLRVKRAKKRDHQEQAEENSYGRGSTNDFGIVGSVVGGPPSGRNISDVSDDECNGGKGGSNTRSCSAKHSSRSNADNARSEEDLTLQGSGGNNPPPRSSSLSLPSSAGGTDPTTADCSSTSSSASLEALVEGGTPGDKHVLSGQNPPAQPKPRIIELYHSSPASSTSTSLSSSSSRSQGLPGGDGYPESDYDGEEDGSLEISLGSSDDTADTFVGMQVSLGSLNLR